jgi:hypothetical protein
MPNKKNTLNDIIKKFQEIESMIVESDGELSEEIESKLLDNDIDLSSKLDGYEKFSKYLKGQVEYLKSAEEQYMKRRKIIENSIKRLRDRMLNAMLVTGKDNIKTAEHNYSISESEKWSIDQELINDNEKSEMINDGLAEEVFKCNLSEIKNKYKQQDIPSWINIEKNKYLRVR